MSGLTFLLGGARSGKSTLAVELAARDGREVTFVATSPRLPGDDELAGRIERHRAERPDLWRTIEAELDLAGAITSVDTPVVVIDCLTVWLGNMFHHGRSESEVLDASAGTIDLIRERALWAVVVSNEVGFGIVPDNALARSYRDLLGYVNQAWARASDQTLLMVAGRAVRLDDPSEVTL